MAKSLRAALVTALAAALLALSGIFVSFGSREVIAGFLSLNITVIIAFSCTAAVAALWSGRFPYRTALVIGGVAGLLVGLALAGTALVERAVDLQFVFANLTEPLLPTLTLGRSDLVGMVLFLILTFVVGLIAAAVLQMALRGRQAILYALTATIAIGLLADQLDTVVAPIDGGVLVAALSLGYFASAVFAQEGFWTRVLLGLVNGAALGLLAYMLVTNGAIGPTGLISTGERLPVILSESLGLALVPLLAALGMVGALLRSTPTITSTFIHYGGVAFLILTLLALRSGFDIFDALAVFAVSAAALLSFPARIRASARAFEVLSSPQKRVVRLSVYLLLVLLLLFAPLYLGQYIVNILNLVGLYIVMGIGLNIVVGNAGLLDLGYVAFFAVGAYTVGLLTTPNLLTCGGVDPAGGVAGQIANSCPGITTFWVAWACAAIVSSLVGILLGTPVLRLRGDYLAIVTLGFGEIIRIALRFDDFSPVFGAAQGIANIPRPVIDLTLLNPAWRWVLNSEASVYYLTFVTIAIVIFVSARLGNSRIGRAWRAIRADEDVAQAMGIQLTRLKLLAFAIGAAFAGAAGGISATRLFGAYPDSFTLLVSINVLSIVIIGGTGSIPGVIIGAFILVGLPEVLREFADYRLLTFGLLLVFTMIARPQGLWPAVLSIPREEPAS